MTTNTFSITNKVTSDIDTYLFTAWIRLGFTTTGVDENATNQELVMNVTDKNNILKTYSNLDDYVISFDTDATKNLQFAMESINTGIIRAYPAVKGSTISFTDGTSVGKCKLHIQVPGVKLVYYVNLVSYMVKLIDDYRGFVAKY